MTAATRQCKRKFQPSITSYFARADRDEINLPIAIPQAEPLSPFLPAAVQASLLNVGMRVRKSVPEGYKTTSKGSVDFDRPTPSPGIRERLGFAELTPYCGIMKIGGHSSQPAPTEEDLPPLQFDNEDDGFPSSQGSKASTICADSMPAQITHVLATTMNNKRRCDDLDQEDLLDLTTGDDYFDFQAVSPRTYPVSHTRMPNLDSIRPLAVPRTRKKWNAAPRPKQGGEVKMAEIEDFEEAEFFKPEDWATTEVEMGGL